MALVIIVEPHTLLRLGILQILANMAPSLQLEGADYGGLDENPRANRKVDLVVLSIPAYDKMHDMIHAAQRAYTPKCILLLSDTPSIPYSPMDLPSVVAGYVPKTATPDVLTASITLVLAGGKCFQGQSHELAPQTPFLVSGYNADGTSPVTEKTNKSPFTSSAESEMLGLTPRQYEVLVLLARGYPIKTIGRQLNISVATAKAHTETLYQRLNVHNRNQAVYAAVSRGATLGWHALPGLHDNPPPRPALLASA